METENTGNTEANYAGVDMVNSLSNEDKAAFQPPTPHPRKRATSFWPAARWPRNPACRP